MKPTDRIDVICCKCGASTTVVYDYWRKDKEKDYYCEQCAQDLRISAMHKSLDNEECKRKARERIKNLNNVRETDEEKKNEWSEKTTAAIRKTYEKKFYEDERKVRVFGTWENWSSMGQRVRAKYPVEVECEECGAKFNTTWEYYGYNKRKANKWRCHECENKRKSIRAKENDPFKHKEGSPYHSKWYNSLSGEDKEKYSDSKISGNQSPIFSGSGLFTLFKDRFESLGLSNKYYLKQELSFHNETDFHRWDCLIYEKRTDTPILAVDLDGHLFHGDGSEYQINCNGNISITDIKRFQTIPKNVKYFVLNDSDFDRSFKYLIEILEMSYMEFIEWQFKRARMIPFPNPRYPDSLLNESFISLIKNIDISKKYLVKEYNYFSQGFRLINYFHRSIYDCKIGKNVYSPSDIWCDEKLLKKSIEDHLVFIDPIMFNKISQCFWHHPYAHRIDIQNPMLAKTLISKFISDTNEIFDPFSSFSSRMLAAMSSNIKFLGSDISEIRIDESKQLRDFITGNGIREFPELEIANVLNRTGVYETLFTSIPYNGLEFWPDAPENIYSCDEWIDILLEKYRCKEYLFIVNKTDKFKKNIVDKVYHMSTLTNPEYVIYIK